LKTQLVATDPLTWLCFLGRGDGWTGRHGEIQRLVGATSEASEACIDDRSLLESTAPYLRSYLHALDFVHSSDESRNIREIAALGSTFGS